MNRVFYRSCETMPEIADGTVQTCVTSPPYWGLRDYGTGSWDGGDPECGHAVRLDPKIESSTLGGGKATTGHQREGFPESCPRCGAVRVDEQIGLEPTPEAYVDRLVSVFDEVRRVLREDGTLWLNLGDSYASAWACARRSIMGNGSPDSETKRPNRLAGTNLKEKDLVGIPWSVAFALRDQGWRLRQDIIWAKPNPMPESVSDRCTKSHEYIFMFSKSKDYFWDATAIAEPCEKIGTPAHLAAGKNSYQNVSHVPSRSGNKKRKAATERGCPKDGVAGSIPWEGYQRNKRDVWTIGVEPYPDAHFATFPPEIPSLCIRAGSKPGDLVLDPFAGSGTTLEVAESLGRAWVGYELNEGYRPLIEARLQQRSLFGAEA